MDTRTASNGALRCARGLTRAHFLRLISGAALSVAARTGGIGAALAAGEQALAADYEVEVYPTGIFPIDVVEVEAAINGGVGPSRRSYAGGGTVRLKATNVAGVPTFFNFGDGVYPSGRSTIEIVKDVVILGERSDAAPWLPVDPLRDATYAPDRTVIYGGKRPFACRPTSPTATKLAVRGLYFAYPSLAAVQVKKSAGLEVSDCVIYDVQSDLTLDPGAPPSVAVGVEATGVGLLNAELTGGFHVKGNRIWRRPPTGGFYGADSGIVLQLGSMVAEIRLNQVVGFAFVGVGIDRNTRSITISDNQVVHCGYGPNLLSSGIGVRGTTDPVVLTRNQIECGEHGSSQWSKNGVGVASTNAIVSSNLVVGNVRLGGMRLTTFGTSTTTYSASNCILHGNNLENLVAGTTQVFVDEGCEGNLLTNNDYGGVVAGSGNAGALVSGAKNQLVNESFWGTHLGDALPCIWLTTTSSGNRVAAMKYGNQADWAMCTQIRDEGWSNNIAGIQHCHRA